MELCTEKGPEVIPTFDYLVKDKSSQRHNELPERED